MAELATIARPYAEALFKAMTASAGVDLDSTTVWLDELAAIAATPQLRQLADNPKVTARPGVCRFYGCCAFRAARHGQKLPAHHDRQPAYRCAGRSWLCSIRTLVNRRSGSSDAVVQSAFPLDNAALADVGGALEKRFGRKLNLSVQLDESLIGGIRVVVGVTKCWTLRSRPVLNK